MPEGQISVSWRLKGSQGEWNYEGMPTAVGTYELRAEVAPGFAGDAYCSNSPSVTTDYTIEAPSAPELVPSACGTDKLAVKSGGSAFEYAVTASDTAPDANAQWTTGGEAGSAVVLDKLADGSVLSAGTTYYLWTRPANDTDTSHFSKSLAAKTWDFNVMLTDGGAPAYGTDFTYENNVLEIKSGTAMTVADGLPDNVRTYDGILVDTKDLTANLTIDGVYGGGKKDTEEGNDGWSPITVKQGTLNLTLKGSSDLEARQQNGNSTYSRAAIYVAKDARIVIDGDGSLKLKGRGTSAGLGGSATAGQEDSGSITIEGGNIFSMSAGYAAGIGSAQGGNAGDITILGGEVQGQGDKPNDIGAGQSKDGKGGDISSIRIADDAYVKVCRWLGSYPNGDADGGSISIEGGTVEFTSNNPIDYRKGGASASITGGKIKLRDSSVSDPSQLKLGASDGSTNIAITGGEFGSTNGDGFFKVSEGQDRGTVFGVTPEEHYAVSANDGEDKDTYQAKVGNYEDLVVTGGERGVDYTYEGDTLTIHNTSKNLTVSNREGVENAWDRLVVDAPDATVNLTIDGVNMYRDHTTPETRLFDILAGDVNLTLKGKNKLESNHWANGPAALAVCEQGSLVIDGDGELEAISTPWGDHAVIGADEDIDGGRPSGAITINGGTVKAMGKDGNGGW